MDDRPKFKCKNYDFIKIRNPLLKDTTKEKENYKLGGSIFKNLSFEGLVSPKYRELTSQ